jgi:hypothetical protein
MKTSRFASAAVIAGLIALTGCRTTKQAQLEQVAKDWCMTIRASQVIPVYPLTEDVQPGDIFLVRTRTEDQAREYKGRGFLPLDHLVGRFQPTNYQKFYLSSYGIGAETNTPHHWKFPANPTNSDELSKAPRAAFPSYSFSVKRGGGLNVALPIQGVPVALNLLGASGARGDITIADAYTFGLDEFSVREQLQQWSQTQTNSLKEYAPNAGGPTNYLRVVSRVYWTGRVNISMFADSSFSGSASGGASKPVDIPELQTTNTAGNYSDAISKLSDSIGSAATPGGTLKVAVATSRSISLVETFPRPLAIDYLAFDVPILEGGILGSAEPTQSKLENRKFTPAVFGEDANTRRLENWLSANPANRESLKKWVQDRKKPGLGVTNLLYQKPSAALRALAVAELNVP